MAFEVFVLLVFLWARTLAARAFPRDPSAEAKALIWIIFASDTFAEMAFVNIDVAQARPDAATTNPMYKNAPVRYPITTAM
eukprot:COSAG06_NODE_10270_length_1714_cov_3.126935_2_plen_81_part_00